MVRYLVGMLAIGGYALKSACHECGSKLTWNKNCAVTGQPVCGSCGETFQDIFYRSRLILEGGRYSKSQQAKFDLKVKTLKDVVDAEVRTDVAAKLVKVFPASYQGKKPEPKLGKRVQTDWIHQRDLAEFMLKRIAARFGCEHITEVAFDTKSDESPDNSYHIITWFKYQGLV